MTPWADLSSISLSRKTTSKFMELSEAWSHPPYNGENGSRCTGFSEGLKAIGWSGFLFGGKGVLKA